MISYLFPYYNQPQMFRLQYEMWLGFAEEIRKQIKIVILDDHSEQPIGDILKELPAPTFDIKAYRILDDIPWNQPGAANLGFQVAETEWCFHGQIDHVVDEQNTKKMLAGNWRIGNCYHFARVSEKGEPLRSPHNVHLVAKSDFHKAGGYDEDFCGHYGYDDTLTYERRQNMFGMKYVFWQGIRVICYVHYGTRGLDRDTSWNAKLLQEKREGKKSFSLDKIRFKWERVL